MNPFPGMNPYLERHWRDVHARLIVYACDSLQAQLPDGLIARIEERVYVDYPRESITRLIHPDIRVSDLRQPVPSSSAGTAAAVLEAVDISSRIIVEEEEVPIVETYIEVVDPAGGLVITVIEVLSVADKVPGEGLEVYLNKQKGLLEAGVNLVEIDLLRTGQRVVSLSPTSLLQFVNVPYLVCVFRSWQPRQREVYPIALNQPLPKVAVPLRPSDADVVLDLQQLLQRCYEVGRYDRLINYSHDPDPPLDAEGMNWLHQLLVEKGLRKRAGS